MRRSSLQRLTVLHINKVVMEAIHSGTLPEPCLPKRNALRRRWLDVAEFSPQAEERAPPNAHHCEKRSKSSGRNRQGIQSLTSDEQAPTGTRYLRKSIGLSDGCEASNPLMNTSNTLQWNIAEVDSL